MEQKSYAIVPFSRIYVAPIWSFSLFLDLTNLCFLFTPAQMSAEQKDLGGPVALLCLIRDMCCDILFILLYIRVT